MVYKIANRRRTDSPVISLIEKNIGERETLIFCNGVSIKIPIDADIQFINNEYLEVRVNNEPHTVISVDNIDVVTQEDEL